MATKPSDTPLLEWIVGGLGALLFAVMLGVLIKASQEPDTPPRIEIALQDVIESDGRYIVEFEALNRGGATAADVEIVAQLNAGGAMVEERRMRFDYLPPHAHRRGGLIFTRDPNAGALVFSIDGYADP